MLRLLGNSMLQEEEVDTKWAVISIRISILGFILIVYLLVKFSKWGYKRYRKWSSSEAINLGYLKMQIITESKGVRLVCNSCRLSFTNGSRNKYKLIEDKETKRFTIMSACCDANVTHN